MTLGHRKATQKEKVAGIINNLMSYKNVTCNIVGFDKKVYSNIKLFK